MFVGGLSWETSEETLRDYFSKFGELLDCVVMKDPTTSRSRGFGFVTFADARNCDDVLQRGPHTLDGRQIDPKVAVPRDPPARPMGMEKTKKVFVGGIPFDATEDELRGVFSKYGKVEEVLLMYDRETRRPRGFGFVTFDTEAAVDTLCDDHFLEIREKRIEVKRAEPKSTMDSSRGRYPSSFAMRGSRGGFGMRRPPMPYPGRYGYGGTAPGYSGGSYGGYPAAGSYSGTYSGTYGGYPPYSGYGGYYGGSGSTGASAAGGAGSSYDRDSYGSSRGGASSAQGGYGYSGYQGGQYAGYSGYGSADYTAPADDRTTSSDTATTGLLGAAAASAPVDYTRTATEDYSGYSRYADPAAAAAAYAHYGSTYPMGANYSQGANYGPTRGAPQGAQTNYRPY